MLLNISNRALGLLSTSYSLFDDKNIEKYLVSPAEKIRSYKFVYLTNIGAFFIICILLIGLIYELLPNNMNDVIQKRIKFFYTTATAIAIALEILIVSSFWILYIIFPPLVVNKTLYMRGYRTPLLKQLSMHVFPLLFGMVEGLNTTQNHSKTNFIVIGFIGIIYYFISFVTAGILGYWQYGFLQRMNNLMRIIAFIGFTGACMMGITIYIEIYKRLLKRNVK